MQFDNATGLYRKSGVRGTKRPGEAHHCFQGSQLGAPTLSVG